MVVRIHEKMPIDCLTRGLARPRLASSVKINKVGILTSIKSTCQLMEHCNFYEFGDFWSMDMEPLWATVPSTWEAKEPCRSQQINIPPEILCWIIQPIQLLSWPHPRSGLPSKPHSSSLLKTRSHSPQPCLLAPHPGPALSLSLSLSTVPRETPVL